MKNITSKAATMIFALILGVNLNATTYYVSPTGTDGDGLSPATAWIGTSKINSATIKPGDKVLFEGGKTFTGNISINSTDANDPNNPVLFSSYGTGKATIYTASTTNHGFYAYNTQGITITNLIFQGAGNATLYDQNNGIFFYSDLATKLSKFTIKNVEVKNFGAIGINFMQWGNTANTGGFNVIVMDSLSVHDTKVAGVTIFCYESSSQTSWQCRNVKLSNSKVYNVPGYATTSHKGDGIVLSQVDSVLIDHCESYNNGTMNAACGGPGGIWVYSANNVTIQFCESHHNSSGLSSGCDGIGYDLDGGVTNSTIQYCYSHDNDGAGYLLGNFNGSRPWGSNTIRYCVSVNDARSNNSSVTLFTSDGTTWNGLKFYNNTIYSTPYTSTTSGLGLRSQSAAFQMSDYGSSMLNIECYNNIFQTTGGIALMNIPNTFVTATSPKFISNLYWTNGGAYKMKYGNSTYTSLSSFRGTNREQLSAVNYGLNADPLLTNVSAAAPTLCPASTETLDAFKITASSPAKDAGIDIFGKFGYNVGLRDYWNNASKSGSAFDIGAHEYTSLVPNEIINETTTASLMVFPNPSNGEFGVIVDNLKNENLTISIIGTDGKTAFATNSSESLIRIGDVGLAAGVYLIHVKGENINEMGKLVIKR
jgi:hypothetical protein